MNALVTGATGFIGSHLCEELLKRGYRVTCLSRTSSNLKWIENLEIRLINGDCTDKGSLTSAVESADFIFHLAGLTKSTREEDFFCVNEKGTKNLIEVVAAKNPRLKRFVFMSSLAAIGPGLDGFPVCEDSEPAPVSSYGKSKLAAEKVLMKYKDSIPITILRPPAVYGPRDKDWLVMFKMIKKGIFFDLGKCYYSMLYVDDLIQGIIVCAENEKAAGEVYFLSDSETYSGEEIAAEIASALNVRAVPLKVPKFVIPLIARIGEKIDKRGIINRDRIKDFSHSYWVCDPRKVINEIGFVPKVGLKEGIKWTADWYRIHRWL